MTTPRDGDKLREALDGIDRCVERLKCMADDDVPPIMVRREAALIEARIATAKAALSQPPAPGGREVLRSVCNAGGDLGCSCADQNYQWFGPSCQGLMATAYKKLLAAEAALSPQDGGVNDRAALYFEPSGDGMGACIHEANGAIICEARYGDYEAAPSRPETIMKALVDLPARAAKVRTALVMAQDFHQWDSKMHATIGEAIKEIDALAVPRAERSGGAS